MIKVLDKGYVRLVNTMGEDLTVANVARVSYNKESKEMTEKDQRLIQFLAKHEHTSPFRHCFMQFEIYAPLLVARQWWKYVVGSDHVMDGWNESSRRYVTEDPEFYIPKVWRSAPDNKKQGSGSDISEDMSYILSERLEYFSKVGMDLYDYCIRKNVAPEQARLFLPAYSLYVRWYWTASLQSLAHFINQRIADDAQREIQEYAEVIKLYAEEKFPMSIKYLSKKEDL